MFLQENKNQRKRIWRVQLTRRGLALAGAGAALVTAISTTPASAATGAGGTQIQQGTGVLSVGWDAQSPRYLNTIRGSFTSVTGVANPRIHVRVLDAQNREMYSKDRSWSGNRRDEYATFEVTVLMPRDASRVCATLYESGGYMDTACAPVYF
ncbi:hypothetical protein JHN55_13860 [Streptomyces sp. MBT56]|uniref:hypothetical protein n=1 Tax=unclassified Streptomyces TaxID=2593676 RepID=UPI00190ABF5D|nr:MULTISPECIES: hypothetical protein [unclassified Streptomyces]MBK3557594.1 hypothetical protein [Streptomyces sp. MBT56]MBK3603519.1 hypothetical protein [Streptomyces sp. MBT54]MBK3615098.1 hypothetical protein [Streptomyces sp. MBT98]